MTTIVLLVYLLSLVNCAVSAGTDVKRLIQFQFVSENYSTQSFTVADFEEILNYPKFDRNKQTALYSYGFTQTVNQPSVRGIVDAYLENGDFNFVLVNYNSILAYTVLNIDQFADKISDSLLKLFDAGYGNFHLIGFSLGAQICGAVGQYVIKKSMGRFIIPRITGLDPGQLPPFFGTFLKELNAGDATFVDTIHGETKFFGSKNSLGNASFWVNGGVSQPICRASFVLLAPVCSHLQTPKYWAESVRSKNPQMFPAKSCKSYDDFKRSSCDGETALMGLYVDPNTNGRFYLDARLNLQQSSA